MKRSVFSFSVLFCLMVACTATSAAEPTYFVVGEFPGREHYGDSYVLPLYNPDDISHARDLILNGPTIGRPLVVANIMAGSDGINRNWLAEGTPLWSWHVTEFAGFGDYTIEILDGSPTAVENRLAWWVGNTKMGSGCPDVGSIGFWSYTIVAEISAPIYRQPPIANAGPDQVVLDKVTLDGSGSYDPDGTIESYQWMLQQRDGPWYDQTSEGSSRVFSNLNLGFYDVMLAVTDDEGNRNVDSMLLAAYGPCQAWPQPDTALNLRRFKLRKNKLTERTRALMLAKPDLPELTLGETVDSRITIELFGVHPEGGDWVMSDEATLTVKDWWKWFLIVK